MMKKLILIHLQIATKTTFPTRKYFFNVILWVSLKVDEFEIFIQFESGLKSPQITSGMLS